MAGTVKASVLQHDVTGAAPVIKDGAGTEIGRFVKAFANIKGTSAYAVNASLNVSSLTGAGSGDYTITFTNAFSDSYYAGASCIAYQSSTTRGGNYAMIYYDGSTGTAPTSSAIRVYSGYGAASGANGGAGDYNPLHWTFTR
jgi:hypothetical protein